MAELVVKDGSRHLGKLIPRGDRLECYDAAGGYIASFPAKARKEAMRAVVEADQRERAKGAAA
jgi:hypothetical protein